MTRFKAAGIHLLISATVVGALALFYFTQWYPPALLEMSRGLKLLTVVAVVDLVLGPLLTLIIFRAGKKGLKFDLTVIAMLQLVALVYGVHTMWNSRPVFLVAVKDRFEWVYANEILPEDLAKARPEYQRLSWAKPVLVSAPMPNDPQTRARVTFSAIGGKDIQFQPEFYRPYADIVETLRPKARALVGHPDEATLKPVAQRLAAKAGIEISQVSVLPLNSSRGAAYMAIDARTGAPLGPLKGKPW